MVDGNKVYVIAHNPTNFYVWLLCLKKNFGEKRLLCQETTADEKYRSTAE
jgi:hypothetical protein